MACTVYTSGMQERVQKILAKHGSWSRRAAEELISSGRVTVDGRVAKIGDRADPEGQDIAVDGKTLACSQEKIYYLLNKPTGVATHTTAPFRAAVRTKIDPRPIPLPKGRGNVCGDGNRRMSVADLLPPQLRGKVFPVGRLDQDSEGLLLLTNDGDLAYRLTHPRFPHEREYAVEVARPLPNSALRKLKEGIVLDGTKTKPAMVFRRGPRTFRIVLTEGRNRQIRRMCEKVGAQVVSLRRIRIATLVAADLATGRSRYLTEAERMAILRQIELY